MDEEYCRECGEPTQSICERCGDYICRGCRKRDLCSTCYRSEYGDDDDEEPEKYTLVGVDGNAFSVMAYVTRAMRECGKTSQDVQDYTTNAFGGDYDHLLRVSMTQLDELNTAKQG